MQEAVNPIETEMKEITTQLAAERKKWSEIRTIIRAFALTHAGENRNRVKSQKYADSVVDSVRLGQMPSPAGGEEALLAFMKAQVGARIDKKLEQITPIEIVAKPAPEPQPEPPAKPKRKREERQMRQKPRRRQRRRSRRLPITMSMSVRDVIENLPTIALLISRLNDLLNPIAKPDSATGEAA